MNKKHTKLMTELSTKLEMKQYLDKQVESVFEIIQQTLDKSQNIVPTFFVETEKTPFVIGILEENPKKFGEKLKETTLEIQKMKKIKNVIFVSPITIFDKHTAEVVGEGIAVLGQDSHENKKGITCKIDPISFSLEIVENTNKFDCPVFETIFKKKGGKNK